MAVFRYFVSSDEIDIALDFVPIRDDRSTILFSLGTTGWFATLSGRFDNRSAATLGGSLVTRYVVSEEEDGGQPLLVAEKFKVTLDGFFSDGIPLDGKDTIFGSAFDDSFVFSDGAGNDVVRGGAGDDTIETDDGADRLFGEDGDDLLVLSYGADRAVGGAGGDLFGLGAESQGSRILDFDREAGDLLAVAADILFDDPAAARGDPEGFVQITGKGTKFTLWLDVDGGGDGFVKWASIKGDLGSSDLATLIADGTLAIV